MAPKSFRQLTLHEAILIKQNKRNARNAGPEWELDDLETSGLDGVLSVVEGGIVTHTPSCSDTTEAGSPPVVLSPSPHKGATRQDESKLSFFDLPAEIRITIYELYCQSLLAHFNLPDDRLPVGAPDVWPEYSRLLLKSQLLCHQLRDELLPVWARYTTFVLERQYDLNRLENLNDVWFHVRDFLGWMDPVARQEVRTVRVCCVSSRDRIGQESRTTPFRPVFHGMLQQSIFGESTGDYLAAVGERLSDVHEDLVIQVEIKGEERLHSTRVRLAMKGVFTMRQEPKGQGETVDWTCTGEKVETIVIEGDPFPIIMYAISDRPDRQGFRDVQWKIYKPANRKQ